MVFHVHIYNVGKVPDTAFSVLHSDIPLDKLYLLNNENPEYLEVEETIRSHFEQAGIEVLTRRIDPFEYHNVYNSVIEIYNKESKEHDDVKVHINFTMGTSIVVGAVCSAAYSINADLYYIQESKYSNTGRDEVIRIEVENNSDLVELKRKEKTLGVFMKFIDRKPKSNPELMTGLKSAASLTYHTRYLSSKGLIERDGLRDTVWKLTPKGERTINRLI